MVRVRPFVDVRIRIRSRSSASHSRFRCPATRTGAFWSGRRGRELRGRSESDNPRSVCPPRPSIGISVGRFSPRREGRWSRPGRLGRHLSCRRSRHRRDRSHSRCGSPTHRGPSRVFVVGRARGPVGRRRWLRSRWKYFLNIATKKALPPCRSGSCRRAR